MGLAPDWHLTDFISCVVEAYVDGRKIIRTAIAHYEMPATATMIYNQPDYVAAVHKAVRNALVEWTDRAAEGRP